jgi:arylsulfatase A-like enzyme
MPHTVMQRLRGTFLLSCLLVGALAACSDGSDATPVAPVPPPETPTEPEPQPASTPNILFIVMDDLGVDQLSVFGYGGLTPAQTPSIDTIAEEGIRFRNAWSMPTCSPSRAAFFEGRYPFRTDVRNAIVSTDLANSQVSPFEVTIPKVLKQQGYVNAVVGKMHISGSELNPANHPLGDSVMRELGWDYFEGYLDGGPFPIDTTAGGVAEPGVYSCGFVPNVQDDPLHGADAGACYLPDGSCSSLGLADHHTPGRLCLERGGILDPGASCQASVPAHINFSKQNGYYTAEWVINREDGSDTVTPASDASSRGYRTSMETDRAIDWIQRQPAGQPWMLSVGYSAIHTPIQPPPEALLREGSAAAGAIDCEDVPQQRGLSNQMLEALDREIGRLLVEAGLAQQDEDGTLRYRPEETNTAVVIVGDNGTYGPSVKAPFNPTLAKGFPYQTGIWVPMLVAGPMVVEPNRDVPHMVNLTDLFSLFAELAGTNARDAVPAFRQLDAVSMAPYLTEPGRDSIREVNYSALGTNLSSTEAALPSPCVIAAYNICVQLFPQQGVCADQGGTWYGPDGAAGPEGLSSCCAVNDYLVAQGEAPSDVMPESQAAIRDADFKLVRIARRDCETGDLHSTDEFYRIDQAVPIPRLDNPQLNLLLNAQLSERQLQAYQTLAATLEQLEASEIECPGDGNNDGVVDQEDVSNWERFSQLNEGRSSWYDFNLDGRTDEEDLAVIEANMGLDCRSP